MPGMLLQLKALNENLTLNQKISIAALGLVTLFGLLSFVYLVQQDDNRLLISDVDSETARRISEKLDASDIEYRLSDGGRSFSVPLASWDRAMLEISSEGLGEKGTVGYELFDSGGWNDTQFSQQVKLKRARQGALERTIRSIPQVKSARVHLAEPKETLYTERRAPAKASVFLTLTAGAELTRGQVGGISNLVASAVPRLTPGNVSVVGPDGVLLSDAPEDEGVLSDRQVRLRRQREDELTSKVYTLLQRFVGDSRVEVRTSVQLDTSQEQEKELIKDPVLLSEKTVRRNVSQRGPVGGTPGLAANQGASVKGKPDTKAPAASEHRNYDFSILERMRTRPAGEIQRISMAVVIDEKTVTRTDDQGQTVREKMAWPAPQLEQMRQLVASSIGLDVDRGDRLTLTSLPLVGFEEMIQPIAPGFWERSLNILQPAVRYIGILMLFLLFYLLIFRPVRRRVFSYVEVQSAQLTAARAEAAQLEEGTPLLALAEANRNPEEERLRNEMIEMARQDPEAVAGLVRDWLSQGA